MRNRIQVDFEIFPQVIEILHCFKVGLQFSPLTRKNIKIKVLKDIINSKLHLISLGLVAFDDKILAVIELCVVQDHPAVFEFILDFFEGENILEDLFVLFLYLFGNDKVQGVFDLKVKDDGAPKVVTIEGLRAYHFPF